MVLTGCGSSITWSHVRTSCLLTWYQYCSGGKMMSWFCRKPQGTAWVSDTSCFDALEWSWNYLHSLWAKQGNACSLVLCPQGLQWPTKLEPPSNNSEESWWNCSPRIAALRQPALQTEPNQAMRSKALSAPSPYWVQYELWGCKETPKPVQRRCKDNSVATMGRVPFAGTKTARGQKPNLSIDVSCLWVAFSSKCSFLSMLSFCLCVLLLKKKKHHTPICNLGLTF